MKKIPIVKGKYNTKKLSAIVDDEDYRWLIKWRWYLTSLGYLRTYIGGGRKNSKHIFMHRMIMGNLPKGKEIDHINGDSLDNRKSNLRFITHQQNIWNKSRLLNTNKTGYMGVCKRKDKLKKPFMAGIYFNNKRIHIGYYLSGKEAAIAYNEVAKKLFGKFAYLNKIK